MLKPLVCVPLLAASFIDLQEQYKVLNEEDFDLIEIRLDYYKNIEDRNAMHLFIDKCKELKISKPVIMTYRSLEEGGLGVLSNDQYIDLMMHLCTQEYITYIDLEYSNESFHSMVNYCKKFKKVLASKHYFNSTPSIKENMEVLKGMDALGVDVAKVAMMPKDNHEVLEILSLTNEAYNAFNAKIVVIGMGELGIATRLVGGQFGSYITYASGVNSSAPGQIEYSSMKMIYDKIYK